MTRRAAILVLLGGLAPGRYRTPMVEAALAGAQTTQWRGTWSATAPGRKLAGSWTGRLGEDPNVVTGAWTLFDPGGRTIASGAWSARKLDQRWEGTWRARDLTRQNLAGSWTQRSPVLPASRLSGLFDSALSKITSGGWRSESKSGAWSIRAHAAK